MRQTPNARVRGDAINVRKPESDSSRWEPEESRKREVTSYLGPVYRVPVILDRSLAAALDLTRKKRPPVPKARYGTQSMQRAINKHWAFVKSTP